MKSEVSVRAMLWTAVLVGCVKSGSPAAAPEVVLATSSTGPWMHQLHADHPLVGRIWSTAQRRFVSETDLLADLRSVDHPLLGEKHDNGDHHRLQARLVAALAPPAVGFEQLDHGAPVEDAASPQELALAVAWPERGWPDFELYAPIFTAAYDTGARVLTAHPPPDSLKQAMAEGRDALDPALTEGLPAITLTEPQRADLADEVVTAHCGHASGKVVDMMVRAQQLKDAWMARALAQGGAGTALVAGNGHTRTDRGVPQYLSGTSRTVAMTEVVRDVADPADYDEPADYLWFTPRVDDEDPCEAFREQLEALGH